MIDSKHFIALTCEESDSVEKIGEKYDCRCSRLPQD